VSTWPGAGFGLQLLFIVFLNYYLRQEVLWYMSCFLARSFVNVLVGLLTSGNWECKTLNCITLQPQFINDVRLVQRVYSIPSPVWLKCCVASAIAQSIQDLYRPACCVGVRHAWCDPLWWFFFFRSSLVTRWEAPGGIRSSSGSWPTIFVQYFDAVGWIFFLFLWFVKLFPEPE